MREITKDTKVSDILREYGDIADVMELFGVPDGQGVGAQQEASLAIGLYPTIDMLFDEVPIKRRRPNERTVEQRSNQIF